MAGFTRAFVAMTPGAVVVAGTGLLYGDMSPGLLVFIAWGLVPYLLLAGLSVSTRNTSVIAGAASAALAAEIGIRLSVFAFPRGSTAAVALVFSPLFIAIVCLPAGGLGGYVVGRVMHGRRLGLKVCILGTAFAGLALLTLQLARPDLFPTAVFHRHRVNARLGPPRVLIGADVFERVRVSDRPSWVQTGVFDPQAGEAIALIRHDGADLIDPGDLSPRGHIAFPAALAWTGAWRLIRLRDRFAIVETGGGYQETQVRSLDSQVLWRYHPEGPLPPSALVPSTPDPGGGAAFYAATSRDIVRLDASGHEVWRQPARMPSLAVVEPATSTSPCWVVAVDQGQVAIVWDGTGHRVGAVPIGNMRVMGVGDWPSSRALLVGGPNVRILGLDGVTRLEWSIEDMSAFQATTIRLAAGGPTLLAILATVPDRRPIAARDGNNPWRLQIISNTRQVVYDEVLGRPARLLKAQRGDGAETLLLEGNGLDALRPRASVPR